MYKNKNYKNSELLLCAGNIAVKKQCSVVWAYKAAAAVFTLATAVCLYIWVTSPMTSVKGFSVAAIPEPRLFISRSHSAKLAVASCKQRETKILRMLHPPFSCTFFSFFFLHCFWDIKGKTINGSGGCPTFPGRGRMKGEKKEKKRGRENSQGCNPLCLGCYVRWVMSVSQL